MGPWDAAGTAALLLRKSRRTVEVAKSAAMMARATIRQSLGAFTTGSITGTSGRNAGRSRKIGV